MKYHFVYKTTNLINNKYYIGVHSTNNIDDNYLGSGVLLRKAIKKYGKKNFKRVIIEFTETKQQAFEIEKQLVTEEIISCEKSYNQALGGFGGLLGKNNGMYGKTHTQEARDKIRVKATGRPGSLKGVPMKRESKEKLRKKAKKRLKDPKKNGMYGKKHSAQSKKKMREAQLGEKHWAYGKRGKRSHNYGKKASLETRKKMSETRKGKCSIPPQPGKLNPRWKGYWITPQGIFETCELAAKFLKKSRKTIRDLCNSDNPNWYISKDI